MGGCTGRRLPTRYTHPGCSSRIHFPYTQPGYILHAQQPARPAPTLIRHGTERHDTNTTLSAMSLHAAARNTTVHRCSHRCWASTSCALRCSSTAWALPLVRCPAPPLFVDTPHRCCSSFRASYVHHFLQRLLVIPAKVSSARVSLRQRCPSGKSIPSDKNNTGPARIAQLT